MASVSLTTLRTRGMSSDTPDARALTFHGRIRGPSPVSERTHIVNRPNEEVLDGLLDGIALIEAFRADDGRGLAAIANSSDPGALLFDALEAATTIIKLLDGTDHITADEVVDALRRRALVERAACG